ncbi:DUF4391 domain-containing protein [Bacillus marinisedimentorum]|uniref:DUF4391 domain-containing protein n=1 Tax=Bacillus marinisedimentorum TaxID=1821260 RepID=UPI0007E2308A|nr:DUF4391 domain-containing protein [Bacillus marinisedimentorum]
MRDWLIQRFEIPARTVLNRKIPKKAFFTQGDLSASEKELFTSQIEGVYLLSVMNQQSINIPVFKTEDINYAEVVWVYVQLRTAKNAGRIVKAVHKAIPNPVVLIMASPDEEMMLSVCHKWLSRNDRMEIVTEAPVMTGWFRAAEEEGRPYGRLLDTLAVTNLSFENFYTFYDDIRQWVTCEKVIPLLGMMSADRGNRTSVLSALEKADGLQKEIDQLKKEQKGLLDFGAKMEFNMKIKRLEQQLDGQLQAIRELC